MKCLALGTYPDSLISVPITTEHVAHYIARRSKLMMLGAVRNTYLGTLDFRVIASRFARGARLSAIPAKDWISHARAETPKSDPFFRMLPLYSTLDNGASVERSLEHRAYSHELARLEMSMPEDRLGWLLDATVESLGRLEAL